MAVGWGIRQERGWKGWLFSEGVVGAPLGGKQLNRSSPLLRRERKGVPLKLFPIHRHPRGRLLKAFPSGSVHVFTKEKMDMAGGGCTGTA